MQNRFIKIFYEFTNSIRLAKVDSYYGGGIAQEVFIQLDET